MSSYTISPSLNANRVFILQRSELEKRFDPFYYVPELVELEKKVLEKQPKKLRHYVQSIASGATPKTTESEKYYTEKENGIPFLRVQNLSPTGVLEFDDCKYINEETHNGMLKRSQVTAGDLLVKITGVGRMAVASVVPEGFEGNINQHICVIKTGSKEASETLAAFLNSDIGEKLASRRSTGGTRPALDYPALLSIPIIEDERILEITAKVVEQKKQNEAEAEKLLASIDDYLLNELGITLPTPPENTLKSRMFIKAFKDISGNRLDPNYFAAEFQVLDNLFQKYKPETLGELSIQISDAPHERPDFTEIDGVRVIMIEHLKPEGIQKTNEKFITHNYHQKLKSTILEKNDLLMARIGVTTGVTSKVDNYFTGMNISGNITLIRLDNSKVNVDFVLEYLNSFLGRLYSKRILSNSARDFLTVGKIKSIKIPQIPVIKQKEIAGNIPAIRQQVQQLKDKTKEALKKASKEIEEILIG
jgi:restriction endonuclease S subunit